MLSLRAAEIKHFMAKLLKENTFDCFCARTVEIETFARFSIYPIELKNTIVTWDRVKPFAYEVIKGQSLPSLIKIIFSMEDLENEFPCAAALFLNILYKNNELLFTTGSSLKTFSLDKTVERSWDDYVIDFFKKNHILYY